MAEEKKDSDDGGNGSRLSNVQTGSGTGLEVIGAGYGRTGTFSTKAALEVLGYNKTHHMGKVIASRRLVDLWWQRTSTDEDDAMKVQWEDIFEGYKAALDWPSVSYYKELAEYYPDAKVVLTVRSAESWYDSVKQTIWPACNIAPRWVPYIMPNFPLDSHHLRLWKKLVFRVIWDGDFEGKFLDRDFMIDKFNRHIDEVKATIDPDRLLVFQVQDGWEPLCRFLDKPVPDVPFPHLNSREGYIKFIHQLRIMRAIPWVFWSVVLLCCVGCRCFCRCCKRRKEVHQYQRANNEEIYSRDQLVPDSLFTIDDDEEDYEDMEDGFINADTDSSNKEKGMVQMVVRN